MVIFGIVELGRGFDQSHHEPRLSWGRGGSIEPNGNCDLRRESCHRSTQASSSNLGSGVARKCVPHLHDCELRQRDLDVIAERFVPICYKEVIFEGGYRLDLQVADQVIVEIKAVENLLPVHHAQLPCSSVPLCLRVETENPCRQLKRTDL